MDTLRKNLIVISAPSGSGKTTICRELQRAHPVWKFSVSHTTRPKRHFEKNGLDYEFVSEKEFRQKLRNNEFVEYEEVHGYLYGTSLVTIDMAFHNNETLLLEVDVKGGIAIKEAFPNNTITVFVKPPSIQELRRRLRVRGSDSEERIRKRLKRMEMEMAFESEYEYSVINDDFEKTIDEIENILEFERNKS